MMWIKNTIIEVEDHNFGPMGNVQFALLKHFEEANRVYIGTYVITINHYEGTITIRNELVYLINYPYKIIIEENEHDYWGTCTARLLHSDRVRVEEPMAVG